MFSYSSTKLKILFIAALCVVAMGCSNLSISEYYDNNDDIEESSKAETTDNKVEVIATTTTEIDNDVVMLEAKGNAEPNQAYQTLNDLNGPCPTKFYNISIPNNGKYCQSFAAELPATMIFFMPIPPTEAVNYYLSNNGELAVTQQVKNRIMLKSADNTKTVVVSPDGVGSQIDILVKPKLQASN